MGIGGAVIRIMYEIQKSNQQRFTQHQGETSQVIRKLKAAKDDLHGGKGWVGQAANAFFKEWDNEVGPAMDRLENWLGQAATTTKKVSDIYQEAEDQWKVILKVVLS